MLILCWIKNRGYMLDVNQNQLDVQQLEKETILLAVNVLQEAYNTQFNLFSLLKFFNGFYLNYTDNHHCVETLESIDEYINEYSKFITNLNCTNSYILENKYVNLYNRVIIKSLFNKHLLNVDIFTSTQFVKESMSLYVLLDKISYILKRRTFLTVSKVNVSNKKHLLTIDEHLPIKAACTYGLYYPNKIGILNDFSTIEKLNIFFKPYFE